MSRNRILLLLSLVLALAAGAVLWLALRGGEDADGSVERLVAAMVTIPGRDYLMGKYEVTQAQWEAVMGGNPSKFKGSCTPWRVSHGTIVWYFSRNSMYYPA